MLIIFTAGDAACGCCVYVCAAESGPAAAGLTLGAASCPANEASVPAANQGRSHPSKSPVTVENKSDPDTQHAVVYTRVAWRDVLCCGGHRCTYHWFL